MKFKYKWLQRGSGKKGASEWGYPMQEDAGMSDDGEKFFSHIYGLYASTRAAR